MSCRSCASSSSRRTRCWLKSFATNVAFSIAAPIWFAMAATSLRSPAVNASAPIRSVRLMTPIGLARSPGVAYNTGTERNAFPL